MRAIYTAASGIKNQQLRLDAIASNVANVNSVGYKSTRVDFKDALYSLMQNPVGGSEENNLLSGNGVIVGATSADYTAGKIMSTGSPMDFAIRGEGFFTVESTSGEKLYTRNGSFGISPEGESSYLVNSEGNYLLDTSGSRITLPKDISNLSVTESGVLAIKDTQIAELGIVEFGNPEGLIPTGKSCFSVSENSGEPFSASDPQVGQGFIEGSNVELAQELTLLMRSQRAFSMASKALQTADEMEGLANNMR